MEIGVGLAALVLRLVHNASKDLVFVDLDLNLLYTFVGDPELENTLEISVAGEVPLNRFVSLPVDFIGEVLQTIGTGGVTGSRER